MCNPRHEVARRNTDRHAVARLNAERPQTPRKQSGSERVTHMKELRQGNYYLRQRNRRGSAQMATVLVAISLIVLLAWLVGLVAWSIS